MSNLETDPTEVTCAELNTEFEPIQILQPRDVPLGGPRAMTVRRVLPQRERSLIGAWCFVDHYGPDDVSTTGGMQVPGHPHTGLQTVSWLFSGEIEHRDTAGFHAIVRPGEMNLMTAGSGIAHSEFSTADTTTLHGVQLWVALPDRDRFTGARFDHYEPPQTMYDGANVRVFMGDLAGESSPVPTFTALLGAEITLQPGAAVPLAVKPSFEHGVLVDIGEASVAGAAPATSGELVFVPKGREVLTIEAGDRGARILLLGGEPLGEKIIMWWNFIGRTHEEIVQFRDQWQSERAAAQNVPSGDEPPRFGRFPRQWEFTLPAPGFPNGRLKPRG